MKLPLLGLDDVEEPATLPAGVDPASVDWSGVRRSAYVIHQRISYRYEGPVRNLQQRLVVQPRDEHGDQRRVARRLRVLKAEPRRVNNGTDVFGNHVVDVSIPLVAEEVTFISWSVVERDAQWGPHLTAVTGLRDPRLLSETRRTTADPALQELAAGLAATGARDAELAVLACSRVHAEMQYEHDVTGVGTTAAEAYALRSGVCQDFAHVMLAVTRRLGMASRYVSGQLLGTGGSHAWVEVLVPHASGLAEVLSLDPTHDCATGMTYVTIAVGRDYGDVAPLSGTYRARHAGFLSTSKTVSVMSIDRGEPAAVPA